MFITQAATCRFYRVAALFLAKFRRRRHLRDRAIAETAEYMREIYLDPAGQSGAMVRSRIAEVTEAVRSGDIFIGGLMGDRWTRLGSDDFGH
ncbi:hypothetical protein Mesop_4129 [Mesorhizobium opportunistum WSM2075]|uniref:Uncharacterized protein n=2 Tax=Phyllobacteriaceae TaxID=69277 RepID=F7Y713_MESOW|nr:hypothetical protein Mesop_4129 [Mesorhizobium opportunistum WSM2075]